MPWKFFTSTGKEKFTEEERNPAGMVIQFAGATAPIGWLACDGSEKAIATYPDLYKAIGTNFGALTNGSGAASPQTHFRVPDLRGRIPVGMHAGAANGVTDYAGSTINGASMSGIGQPTGGTSMSARSIGDWRGRETVTLADSESGLPAHSNHTITESAAHYHTITESGSHSHGYGYTVTNYVAAGNGTLLAGVSTYGPWYYSTTSNPISASINQGTSGMTLPSNSSVAPNATTSHDNVQPSLVVNFIIKT